MVSIPIQMFMHSHALVVSYHWKTIYCRFVAEDLDS